MTGRIRRTTQVFALLGALVATALPLAGPAQAAQAKVLVGSYAWYWEDQQSHTVQDPTGADAATVETPNPFCPGPGNGLGAPQETCRSGRLPVEVRGGDYETPSMMSAVAFDLFVVPLGSEVHSFKVTFLEANDDQSRPINATDRQIQACLVEEFFGDGEARKYGAAPRHGCAKSDPKAKRKPVKGEDERFQYTFDLTSFAKDWVMNGAPATAIMLYPVEPKDAGPGDNTWRVVLDGPLENEGKSFKAKIVYTPAPEPEIDFDDPADEILGSGSTGDFTTSTSDDFGTGTSSVDAGEDVPAADGDEEPVEVEGDEEPAVASEPFVTTNQTPWYVWAAILAGIVGFSLVRSVVLESHAGIRPDGVLAQIRRLNSERRGAPIEAVASGKPSPLAPVLGALAAAGRGTRSLAGKLPFIRRKG